MRKHGNTLRERTLDFVQQMRLEGEPYGRYRYAPCQSAPALYSSCYAAMTRHLYGDLDALTDRQRRQWIDYLQSFQDDDGLFRDRAIYGQGWYQGEVLWCGPSHLSCHVIIALTCLGATAEKPMRWLDPFTAPGAIERWLAERDWVKDVDLTGNEVMNVGTLLQYARDFQANDEAGRTVETLLAWMETHHLNPETGLWGDMDLSDPIQRSRSVQAAYHFWPLWTYDRKPIPHVERAADQVLATQNPLGGFGWGSHNGVEPFKSSACEDIDSIEPLCRFLGQTPYRRDDILAALRRARPWVVSNANDDGGFVFMRDRPFEYGHPILASGVNESAMFPTWFRTLCLAYLDTALGETAYHFRRCPGYQFGL